MRLNLLCTQATVNIIFADEEREMKTVKREQTRGRGRVNKVAINNIHVLTLDPSFAVVLLSIY